MNLRTAGRFWMEDDFDGVGAHGLFDVTWLHGIIFRLCFFLHGHINVNCAVAKPCRRVKLDSLELIAVNHNHQLYVWANPSTDRVHYQN